MDENRKLNIGLFIDTFFPMVDGVVMVVDNYARRLAQHCNVTVFTLRPRGYKKDTRTFPYKTVRCGKLIVPFLDYDLPTPKLDRKFMRELENSNLDIVHIHSPFSIGNVGIAYAKKHNVPVIATMHSQFKLDFMRAVNNKTIAEMLLKKVVKTFDKCDEYYATNVNHAKLFFEDYKVSHLPLVQRNGTDMLPVKDEKAAIDRVNAEYRISPDTPVFLFVGRINKLKNIYFLLEALTKLRHKDFVMIFVGDGQDMHNFKNKVKESTIADKVIFTGKITDRELLTAIYLRAKLFLFPSLYDASSLVQIEAASQHTPTVFLRGSVTSGTVTEDVNGFISDCDEQAFADKIDEILENPELYEKVSEGAFRDLYVTWDDCVSNMFEIYKRHIEESKNKA